MIKKVIEKTVTFFLFFLLAFHAAAQTETDSTTVKIGWYKSANFQEGQSDSEPKSGFCYEYLQKISDYNGWQYEYVYGEWSELLEKLENGQIDALAGVSKTAERLDVMSFPNSPMGDDYYYLFQHSDDKKMNPSDLSSFNGCKIGGVKNNRMTDFLEGWAKDNDVHFNMVYYDGFDQRDKDFADHKIDGISATDNNISSNNGYSVVVKVGEEPYYLAIAKNRSDLLKSLNDALELMQKMDPYFLQVLQYTYYGTTTSNAQLTEKEQAWVDSHKVLKLGYMDNYLPYCKTDANGHVYGLVKDVFSAILTELKITDKITVQYIPYKNYEEMVDAVANGNVDAVFPIGGSIWEIDKNGMDFTTSVVNCSMELVYKGNYSDKTASTIAANKNNLLHVYYVKSNFPDSEILEFNSIEDCLNAVKEGKTGATVINGLRVNLVRNNSKYSDLSTFQLKNNDNRYLGVKSGNFALLMLLNRGLKLIGRDFGINTSYKYLDEFYVFTTKDFLRRYAFNIFAVIFLIVLGFVLFLIHDVGVSRQKTLKEKRLNEKLELAKAEADRANQAKTDFLFNMSHDIRTPMNAIIGFSDLIEKNYDDKEKCMKYLHNVQKSSNFLLSLINDILEMTKIENGKLVLEESENDALSIIDDFTMMFEDQMIKKNLTYTKNIDIKNKYVVCDAAKVREIYLNLISNAYKYTPSGGKVSVTMKELASDKEGYITIEGTVSDTGIGMSEEYLPHIYEVFTRAQNATESRIEGTGLGMAIVKNLIDLMDGTITVESEQGKGTTFVVRLTHKIVQRNKSKADGSEDIKSFDFSGKRILLAEDNDLNAEIAMEILKASGFEIERAVDGVACVEMLQRADENYFNLILMDIQMPNMNGYDAAKTIRSMENETKRNIPIIAMTANAFEEDRQNALKAGMNGHIRKPVNINELFSTLKALMG